MSKNSKMEIVESEDVELHPSHRRGRKVTFVQLHQSQQLKFGLAPKQSFGVKDGLELWESTITHGVEIKVDEKHARVFPNANIQSYEVEI